MSRNGPGGGGDPRETVVAIATPEGESGLAVVRMSGPLAVQVARQIFQNNEFERCPESHHAYHGRVIWPVSSGSTEKLAGTSAGLEPGQTVDEVVALPMLAPRSYTGEDSIEFFCHGGRVPARLVMTACLRAGAVAAGPGEFTRRAFVNGKLSLDQAEAVADLIHAENELTAVASLRQLQGGFDRELQVVETPLHELLTDLEGGLEFTEAEGQEVPLESQVNTLVTAMERLRGLLSMAASGRRLREGVQVVLTGPPNVGKSSLFNALLGESRVLVDHEPGTTRDLVTARTRRDGILFVLYDTAGLREMGSRVEKMGMDRTRQAISRADVVLRLQEATEQGYGILDGSESQPADSRFNESIFIDKSNKTSHSGDKCELFVVTKMDLVKVEGLKHKQELINVPILTSSQSGEGIDELWQALMRAANQERMRMVAAMGVVMNVRHQQKLIDVLEQLSALHHDLVENHPGNEVVSSWLAGIMSNLGEVSGRVFSENLLDSIFSRFCVGK